MRILLLTVGRCRDAPLNALAARYRERIARYGRLEEHAVKQESGTARTDEEIRAREGRRLLAACSGFVVALDPAGECPGSEELARRLDALAIRGTGRLACLVGGPLGLSPNVLERADWQLSLSPFTFPHEWARVILLEQLYRAFTILRGEPYHK